MAQQMTNEEYRSFMIDRTRTAVLATVRVDGGPRAAPIWFDLDGEICWCSRPESTVKGRNMRRDARVSQCIDEEEPPFHFVLIEGAADLTAGDPDLLYWATRIGGRYMGPGRAEEYGSRNAVEGELLVRMMPQKIVAYKNVSD